MTWEVVTLDEFERWYLALDTNGWYEMNVPRADDLYDDYLNDTRR